MVVGQRGEIGETLPVRGIGYLGVEGEVIARIFDNRFPPIFSIPQVESLGF